MGEIVTPRPPGGRRGLVVDWGGVLTERLDVAGAAWAKSEGIDWEHYLRVMVSWVGADYAMESKVNPVHALERGEMTVPHFEERLAAKLCRHDGAAVRTPGLIDRMLSHFEHAPAMNALVRRARTGGIRTALLSNSWGTTGYVRDAWADMFDVVVISGEVGRRKPEPEIFALTCERLALPAAECVFVDDMVENVEAARDCGMVAILHEGYAETAAALERLFDQPLA